MLLAPNGKESNLTPEQYKLVRTPQFKAWFGDWENEPANSSKVIDENGEPLVVYHGTRNDFNIFKVGKTRGIFFTDKKSSAELFSEGNLKREGLEPHIKECFLNIKKPFYKGITKDEILEKDYWNEYFNDRPFISKKSQKSILSEKDKFSNEIVFFGILNEEGKKKIIQYNYDGVVFDADNNAKTYVAFEPEQIKLADGTNKTFDSSNPDVKYANGGLITEDNIEVFGLDNYTSSKKSGRFYHIYAKRKIGDELDENWWIRFSRKDGVNNLYYIENVIMNTNDNIEIYFPKKKLNLSELPKSLLDIYNNPDIRYKKGGRTISQTPAPAKDRIKGSKVNPKGSASSEKSAKQIKFDAKTIIALNNKLKEFREKHSNKNITLNDLKAVYRRGLGAYSTSHRPNITRGGWAMGRVNAFLSKAGGGKHKKAYVQDDDLMKYENGALIENEFDEVLKSFYHDLTNSGIFDYLGLKNGNYTLGDNEFVIFRDKNFTNVEKIKIVSFIQPYFRNYQIVGKKIIIKLKDKYLNGGEIDKLIDDGVVELKMFSTTNEHSKIYGFDAENPLYVQSLIVSKSNRMKGIGTKVMQYIIEYADKNGHDVIFGHITQKAEPNIDVIKSMLQKSGFNTIDGNNDFYKLINVTDMKYADGGEVGQDIKCRRCGWEWNTSQSEEFDKYVCHNCGFDNRMYYDVDPIGYADGGEVDDKKKTYAKWKSLVNMSYGEIKKFYDSKEGKEAGLSTSEANKQGINSGRESARMIMKMKTTPKDKWTDTMWKWANKQISFISRMSGMQGELYDGKGNKTRKHTSLLIWGHNPKKSSSMKYENGGLLAPNGNKSNLTHEQYKLVRTPEFKAWFGDWEKTPKKASKVVDENGEPLVMYHKTDNSFNIFDKDKLGDKSGWETAYFGFYFSNKIELGYGKKVLQVFLNIKKPYLIKTKTYSDFDYDYKRFDVDKLNKNDGIRIDIDELQEGEKGNIFFVAFEPEQIKLADGKNTTFDAKNPDIRYDNGGEMDVLMQDTVQRMDNPNFADISYYKNGGLLKVYHYTNENIEDFSEFKDGVWVTTNSFGYPLRKGLTNKVESYINPKELNFANEKQVFMAGNGDYKKGLEELKNQGFDGVKRTIDGDKEFYIFDNSKFKKMKNGGETDDYNFSLVIKNIENPTDNTYKSIQNMYRGAYKKIFDILEEDSIFSQWATEEEKLVGNDLYLYFSNLPDSDKIEKIAKIKNVEILKDYENGGELQGLTQSEIDTNVHKIATKFKLPLEYINSQLKLGIKFEMEHTNDKSIASKIAIDHLNESPYYYQKLSEMEKELSTMENKKNVYLHDNNKTMRTSQSYKEGGNLKYDSANVKEYFAHGSGNAGGVLVGKRHSEGGIKAINKSTGQPLEMEGGEVVITRNAVSDDKKREFEGEMLTNKEILSRINESGGGVKIFSDGGDIESGSCSCSGKSYKYGGKMMVDYDIAKDIANFDRQPMQVNHHNSLKNNFFPTKQEFKIVETNDESMSEVQSDDRHEMFFIKSSELNYPEGLLIIEVGTTVYSVESNGTMNEWGIEYFTENSVILTHKPKHKLHNNFENKMISFDELKEMFKDGHIQIKGVNNERELGLILELLKGKINKTINYKDGGLVFTENESEDEEIIIKQFGNKKI